MDMLPRPSIDSGVDRSVSPLQNWFVRAIDVTRSGAGSNGVAAGGSSGRRARPRSTTLVSAEVVVLRAGPFGVASLRDLPLGWAPAARAVLFRSVVGSGAGRPLDRELLRALVRWGVVFIGTDAASIEPPDEVAGTARLELAARGVEVGERLDLDGVAPGIYGLITFGERGVGDESVRTILVDPLPLGWGE